MNQQKYISFSAPLFLIIAIMHALRIVNGWPAVFAGWTVPMSLSWVALVVTGYLAWQGWRLNRK